MIVKVPLATKAYDIHIERGLLHRVGGQLSALPCRRWAVIADETVSALYAAAVCDSLTTSGFACTLLTFPSGEGSKTLQTYESLCSRLCGGAFTRQDGILALGGGVTGDVAGFVAATYLRGVTLVHVPTTLLAQVDSAVGGKCGVDTAYGKNLLGAVWQPDMVLIDPDCLASLPQRQLSCGAAEVIKYALIAGGDILTALAAPQVDWPSLIARCVTYKAALVAQDERDTGVRRVLNFGHTFGHAYEALGGYAAYTHGSAVAAGMGQMLRWQAQQGFGCGEAMDALTSLCARFSLPTAIRCEGKDLAPYLQRDKKNGEDGLQVITLERVGHAVPRTVEIARLLEVEA